MSFFATWSMHFINPVSMDIKGKCALTCLDYLILSIFAECQIIFLGKMKCIALSPIAIVGFPCMHLLTSVSHVDGPHEMV